MYYFLTLLHYIIHHLLFLFPFILTFKVVGINIISISFVFVLDSSGIEIETKGEPKIDLSKIVTGKGSLDDLDQETRMTIDKMLYDQKKKEEQGFYKN